nr:unnamed protein product [Callosobruchus chinensis]
MADTLDIKIH